MFLQLFLAAIPAALLAILIIPIIVKKTEDGIFLDMPDERKTHTIPISRFGGVCFLPIVILVTVVMIFLVNPIGFNIEGSDKYGLTVSWRMVTISFSALILYISGIFDDLYGLNYKIKFLMQIFSALIISGGLCYPIFGMTPRLFLATFFIIYCVNAMNLIDGIDGLASGIAIIALIVLAAIHFILNNLFGAILASSLCGVLIAYYYYNVFSLENKIFMGDTGSLTIGLIIAYLIVSVSVVEKKFEGHETFYLPIALSTIFIPLFDTVRVAICRMLNHKNPFLADKTHVHHRMMANGYTALQTMRLLLFQTGIIIIIAWVALLLIRLYL